MQSNHTPTKTKCCIRCGIEKPVVDFFVVSAKDGRRRGHCKACHRKGLAPEGPWKSRVVSLRQRGHVVSIPALREALGNPSSCYLCGGELSWESAAIDHVVPLVKGGGGDVCNLRWAHRDCNRMKGELGLADALALMRRILEHFGEFAALNFPNEGEEAAA